MRTAQREEDLLPLRVETAHAPDMARQMALGNELREHRLIDDRRVATLQGAPTGERLHERQRQYDVAEPHRREHDLAQRADIQDAIRLVETLQARQRPTGVAI